MYYIKVKESRPQVVRPGAKSQGKQTAGGATRCEKSGNVDRSWCDPVRKVKESRPQVVRPGAKSQGK